MARQPLTFWPEGPNADSKVADDEPASAVMAEDVAATERSDAIIAGFGLADPPSQPEDWWVAAGLSFPDLRAVLVRVIVETATHAPIRPDHAPSLTTAALGSAMHIRAHHVRARIAA